MQTLIQQQKYFEAKSFFCHPNEVKCKAMLKKIKNLSALAKKHGFVKDQRQVVTRFSTKRTFKQILSTVDRQRNIFVIANLHRKKLKHTGEGHYMPIAALSKNQDHCLLMEVARFKYGSAWVKVKRVYNAMKSIDSTDKNVMRGFLVVCRRKSAKR